jgi:hypothetical protein
MINSSYNQENAKRFIIAVKQKLQVWYFWLFSVSKLFVNNTFWICDIKRF